MVIRRSAIRAQRPLIAALLAAAVTGPLAGCRAQPAGDATPPPPSATAPPSNAAPAAPASPTEPAYNAIGLDLCRRTDLVPLADLSLTVRRTRGDAPPSAPGSACLFELRTPDDHEATLRVEAASLPSVQDAQRLYRTTRDVTVLDPDAAVPGLAQEAEGFSRRSDPGFKKSEYLIHARQANLVVKVWLAVGGTSFTDSQRLADRVRAITRATLDAVPRA